MKSIFSSFILAMFFLSLPEVNAQVADNNDLFSKLARDNYKVKYSSDYFKEGVVEKTTGKIIVYPIYDKIVDYDIRYKVFTVNKDGYYGVVNTDDKVVIPTKYKKIEKFSEGIACVDADAGLGFIDYCGNVIAPCQYKSVGTYFSEGLVFVKIGELWGIINSDGEMVAQPKYEKCGIYKEGAALVKRNGLYGFVDNAGREIITPQYENGASFSEGLAPVKKDGKWGFINRQNKIVIPCEYDAVATNGFFNGRTFLWKKDKVGLFDRTGNMLIPPIYDMVYPFHDDRAAVVSNGKLGFVDKTGQLVIPCIYDTRSDESLYKSDGTYKSIDDEYKFFGNVAYVKYKGKYQLIDKFGHTINNKRYDTSSPYWSLNLVVKTQRGGKVIYVNLRGEEFTNKHQAQLSSWKYVTSRMNDFEAETQCMIGSYFYYGKENLNQAKDTKQAFAWLNAAKQKGLKGVGYKGNGRYDYDIAYMLSKCHYEINEEEQPAEIPMLEWLNSQNGITTNKMYVLRIGIKSKSAIKDEQVLVNGQRQLTRGINSVRCDGFQQILNQNIILAEGENKVKVIVRNKAGEAYSNMTILYRPNKNAQESTPFPVEQEKRIINNQKRVALVIGNNVYKSKCWPQLTTAKNDVKAVVTELNEMGYEVDSIENAKREEIDSILNVFAQKAANSDAAIFYYAGHGISNGYSANYMVPIDAKELNNDDDIEEQCVKMSWVLDYFAGAKVRILLLDNCRTQNLLNTQKKNGIQSHFQKMDDNSFFNSFFNSFILYSTSNGYGAYDAYKENDMHSPFAEAVLSTWKERGIGISVFARRVRSQVRNKTAGAQLPCFNDALGDDNFKF